MQHFFFSFDKVYSILQSSTGCISNVNGTIHLHPDVMCLNKIYVVHCSSECHSVYTQKHIRDIDGCNFMHIA